MSWFDAVPQFVPGVALLFLPGMVVALAAKVRGIQAVAVAPGISVSMIAVAGIVAPFVGLPWSVFPVLALTAVVAGIALLVSARLVGKGADVDAATAGRRDWTWTAAPIVALVVAAILIGRRLFAALGQPASFSQTFDNVFHLNAIRYILDTGSGSSLTLNSMTGAASYPAAWHDLVSLLVSLVGDGIPTSVNIMNVIIAAMVWPLGCIFLARTLWGNRPVVSISAGVSSAAFGAFPISLLDFGVLYPNFLAVALLPSVIAVGLHALGLSELFCQSRLIAVLLLLVVLCGLALAHPSAAMAWIALMLPPATYVWGRSLLRAITSETARRRAVAATVLILVFVIVAVTVRLLWGVVRPPAEAAFWPPIETSGQAIGQVVSSAAIGRPVAWAIMVLTLFGAYVIVRSRRQVWFLGTYAMAAFLYVVVSSFPADDFRSFVTGIWYNDSPRLAALLPIVTLPLACRGAICIWDLISLRLVPRALSVLHKVTDALADRPNVGRGMRRGPVTAVLAVALVLVLTMLTQRGNVRQAQDSMAEAYRLTDDSALISSDEMALLNRLPAEVPEDAVLVGNPWNGSSLAYAFADRKLVQLHILSAVPEGTAQLLNGPAPSRNDPEVCSTVERLNIAYILDFGHREVHGRNSGYRGLDGLISAGMATLEDSEGDARLYRLSLCGF